MEVACVMVFKPEGIFEKWRRGEDVQPGDFESKQLREWVAHELDKIAVRAERAGVEEAHKLLTEVLELLNFAGYMTWRFPDLKDLLGLVLEWARPVIDGIARRFGAAGWSVSVTAALPPQVSVTIQFAVSSGQ
jgi:hypothetical protein